MKSISHKDKVAYFFCRQSRPECSKEIFLATSFSYEKMSIDQEQNVTPDAPRR